MLCMRVPLASRGYSAKKLADNMEAEIMQVILDEARESYQEEIVVELPSNTIADLESNVERAASWLQSLPRALHARSVGDRHFPR